MRVPFIIHLIEIERDCVEKTEQIPEGQNTILDSVEIFPLCMIGLQNRITLYLLSYKIT